MIFDLKTQEPYLALLYEDATDVIFLGQHGEARVSAKQFAEAIDLREEGGLVWATVGRYQSPLAADVDPAETLPQVRIRRGELARYAAANGGQVHTHTKVKRPRNWAQRLLGAGGRAD